MTPGRAGPEGAIARALSPDVSCLGIAVSGGSDSTALLLLAKAVSETSGLSLHAVTVDHGLRDTSAAEAQEVAALCKKLDVPHDILRWQGWDGTGNLQDAARRARFALIADWARARGIANVALGHTADDQAETFLMRLARASGIDGLSGMAPRRVHKDVTFLRPLLDVRRAELRAYLVAKGVGWIEDPSNEDATFDRVRMRQAQGELDQLGLNVPALARAASNLRDIRNTLDAHAADAARAMVRFDGGDILIDRADLSALPTETRRRILIAALRWISGETYPPRGAALTRFEAALTAGETATLSGVLALGGTGPLRLTREAAAVATLRAAPGAVWDGRWRLTGPATKNAEVRALGEAGVAQCPSRRDMGIGHATALALPGVWCGETLVAAPLLGLGSGWRAELIRTPAMFHAAFLPH